MQQEHVLQGKVALVAGATRGAGRAIARELGSAGAIVYCTGRSTRTKPSDYGRPESIEETAELINDHGGTAHPVVVDHRIKSQVQSLVDRIEADRKSTRLNSSHVANSYAVFCLKKKKNDQG